MDLWNICWLCGRMKANLYLSSLILWNKSVGLMLLSESRTMKNCFAMNSEGLLRQRSLGEFETQSRVGGQEDIKQRGKMILTNIGTDLILRLLVYILIRLLMYNIAELSGIIHTCDKFPLQPKWRGCIVFMNEKSRGLNFSDQYYLSFSR